MTRIQADQPLVPSLLDRLLDDEPELSREPIRSRTQVLRDLLQSVRRDLENLLNTRRRVLDRAADLSELESSAVHYGLQDFTGADMGSPRARDEFRALVERVLRLYEPRFKTVRVEMLDNADTTDRALRFRIDALLRADPAPEPIVFDSMVEPGTGAVSVKATAR